MLTYRYAAVTHQGRVRSNNEDNFYIDGFWKKDVNQGQASCSGFSRDGRLTGAVCDGMGGEAHGEDASLTAVETIHKYVSGDCNEQVVNACIQEANGIVCGSIRQSGERSGSTVCILSFNGPEVFGVNLGDSRIYDFRDRGRTQIAIDHSVVGRMIRQGLLTEEEAKKHPMRHQITQYLGIEPEEMGRITAENAKRLFRMNG